MEFRRPDTRCGRYDSGFDTTVYLLSVSTIDVEVECTKLYFMRVSVVGSIHCCINCHALVIVPKRIPLFSLLSWRCYLIRR